MPNEYSRDDEIRLLRRLYHINVSNSLLKDEITMKFILAFSKKYEGTSLLIDIRQGSMVKKSP